jgi:hypothetical protein
MDSSEVKELWENKMAVEYYNIQQQQSQQRNNYNNPRPKNASRNYEPPGNSMSNNNKSKSNLWYLDLFNTDFNSASFAKGGS